MHYTVDIEINLPREQVVALFTDTDRRAEWQPGLKSIELFEGTANEQGAVSRIVFAFDHGEMVMSERVLVADLPDRIDLAYGTEGVLNLQSNRFEAVDDQTTRWTSANEFQFSPEMAAQNNTPKKAYSDQTSSIMQAFKEFAEAQ